MNSSDCPQRVVIAGGSGFLGVSLAHHLSRAGWSVILLSRHVPRCNGPWDHVSWDARTTGDWVQALEGAYGLVNLVGRSVDCIKTPDHQDEIVRSRVEATRVLGMALRNLKNPPAVWLQMSTAHIYGDPPDVVCTEESPIGVGFAPTVGVRWESEFEQARLPGIRGVIFRTSFVLGHDQGAGGGALTRLTKLARRGLGGTIHTGRQEISWIHETDWNCLFEQALKDISMQGIYLATAPHPVSQTNFMSTLRKVLRVPFGLPATETMVRFGARFLLRTDPELALYGRYAVSSRLSQAGFTFRFPVLEEALRDLLQPAGGPDSPSTGFLQGMKP